ncbi:twin-arginine translocation signal domain-containing protein [Nonomuraea sp. NPDC049269]|uniref:twin-arginine translocation signal domain-containing protein n=1 Tax=Nonomuraea sp. NPDC049269 TaxID=3364349 RepID=UPI00371AC85C
MTAVEPTPFDSPLRRDGHPQSRRDLLKKAALVGLGAGAVLATEPAIFAKPAAAVQSGWAHCYHCRGLFYPGNGPSACPLFTNGNGSHSTVSDDGVASWNYALWTESSGPSGFQKGWRWCSKCQGLFYLPNGNSHCPKGGAHNGTGSFAYMLEVVPPGTTVGGDEQAGWTWCRKCQGLFFGPFQADSYCPVFSTNDALGHHTGGGISYNYSLLYVP